MKFWFLVINIMVLRPSLRTRRLLDKLIRVDHAGELAARLIYKGQHAVLKNTKSGPIIQHMYEEEKKHLDKFEELIPLNRVRPTALRPVWSVAAYALGLATGLMGERAAMACTVAVESVVGQHYNNQIRELLQENPLAHAELLDVIKQFRDDELEHHDIGIVNEAEMAPCYEYLTQVVKIGSKASIWIAEKI